MNNFDKRFERQRKFVNLFIYLVLAIVLIVIGGFLWFGYIVVDQLADMDWSHGLKGVFEKLWYGVVK